MIHVRDSTGYCLFKCSSNIYLLLDIFGLLSVVCVQLWSQRKLLFLMSKAFQNNDSNKKLNICTVYFKL